MYGLGYGGYGAGFGAGCGTTTRCWYVAPTNNCAGVGIIAIAVLILIALGAIFTF